MIYEFAISPDAFEEAGNSFMEFDGISQLERILFSEQAEFCSVFVTADEGNGWFEEIQARAERLPDQSRHRAFRLLSRLRSITRCHFLRADQAELAFAAFCRGKETQFVDSLGKILSKCKSHSGFVVSSKCSSKHQPTTRLAEIADPAWGTKHVPRELNVPRSKAGQEAIFKRICDFAEHLFVLTPYLQTEQATVSQLLETAYCVATKTGSMSSVTVITTSNGCDEVTLKRLMKNVVSELPSRQANLSVRAFIASERFVNRRLLAQLTNPDSSSSCVYWGLKMEHPWAGGKNESSEGNFWSVLRPADCRSLWQNTVEPVVKHEPVFIFGKRSPV